ncbi:conserved oligomeric golgi complex subunit 3-like [Dermatophagoides farinae]|uniref:Conserved oligomeric Golgi complex subunit 3 n=2 Tax=Dermatophagoides farinae TaxID=6954 RepID=A0A9D4NVV0_DERFA|nr:conserved oligomeric golgi complex subunit 3-like [Dermatophagoides farinae]
MNSNFLDRWERDDADSLAPLSTNQQKFIDRLIDLIKDNDGDKLKTDESEKNRTSFDNVQDFYKRYNDLENEIHIQSDERFRKINEHHRLCMQLTELVGEILASLNRLDEEYSSVIDKTKSFYSSCDTLLQQQQNLLVAIEAINEKLSYFEDLETMSKKFSSPTMLTLNESLIPLLHRLDECIEFMSTNIDNYLEANKYLIDYRRFQTSALNTIRTHVINTLKQTETQVMPENDTVLTSNESVFTLYYGKFQLNAHRIKTLMQQIENRTKQSETFNQFLNDCHQCYFQIRDSLITPVLTLAMDEMIQTSGRNFCSLIRSSAKLYTHICRDEYQLYFQFFTQVDHSLGEFLDQLCMSLYDKLRPIIIHLEHLESLSEICSLIKFEFIEENLHQDELESFVKAMQQLLQDTQERLVYRCNVHVEKNILNYSPASGDLAYPEKLEMMKSISETLETNNVQNNTNEQEQTSKSSTGVMKRSDSVSSIISSISDISFVRGYHHPSESSRTVSSRAIVDLHGMWYPTVRSSIMCLSKLYRSLDKLTFQGLSQEVLLACIESLESALLQIKQRKGPIDGYLFIIKYLLIIREQITPFQIDTSIKEVYLDFTRTKTAVIDLLQKRENLFSLTTNNALLKLIFESSPQVSEKVIDSQKAVDNKIKEKCEEFIMFSYEYLTADVRNFIVNTKFDFTANQQQPSPTPSEIQLEQLKLKLQESIQSYLDRKESLAKSMSLYLANVETEAIIFKQINNKIQELFEQLSRILQSKFPTFERSDLPGLLTV